MSGWKRNARASRHGNSPRAVIPQRAASVARPKSGPIIPTSLSLFRNLCLGKPAYVLGGGVSLERANPELAKGHIILGANEALWAESLLGFPPVDYWMCYDCNPLNRIDPKQYLACKIVLSDPGRVLSRRGMDCHCPSEHIGPIDGRGNGFIVIRKGKSEFTADADCVRGEISTLHGLLHLALVMGCNPIHIRGLDCGNKSADGRFHWWEKKGGASQGQCTFDPMIPLFRDALRRLVGFGINITVGQGTMFAGEFPAGE